MDTLMWTVVATALALALGMAALAWRLLRSDRARTRARVDVLQQLAFEPEPEWQDLTLRDTMVPAFGAVSHEDASHALPHTRRWMAIAVVVLFLAFGAGSVYGLLPIDGANADGAPAANARAASRGDVKPLDLLSLSHRVEGTDFIVAGLIENPVGSRPATGVIAVVYVFNQQGEYFASGRAAIEFPTLPAGAEASFLVRLPITAGVSRYRVGFRSEDGAVVAHADRRGRAVDDPEPAVAEEAGGL